jgi:nitrogen fixation/metabolism regulation signal transduction histidine kinase
MAFGCAVLLQQWRQPDTSPSAVMQARARQALKRAQAEAETGEAFLTALHQALTAAIFAATGRTGEALTWKEAESTLLDMNISKATATRAAELLSKIESLKFGGAASKANPDRSLLNQTRKMVRELVK